MFTKTTTEAGRMIAALHAAHALARVEQEKAKRQRKAEWVNKAVGKLTRDIAKKLKKGKNRKDWITMKPEHLFTETARTSAAKLNPLNDFDGDLYQRLEAKGDQLAQSIKNIANLAKDKVNTVKLPTPGEMETAAAMLAELAEELGVDPDASIAELLEGTGITEDFIRAEAVTSLAEKFPGGVEIPESIMEMTMKAAAIAIAGQIHSQGAKEPASTQEEVKPAAPEVESAPALKADGQLGENTSRDATRRSQMEDAFSNARENLRKGR